MKKENLRIDIDKPHFLKFIKIFSFTSASKIISGIAFGIDMVVLARVIPPAMITTYEINKRPINFANTLVGRHSVALMPVISHAKGSNDKASIINLIKTQFKLYCYAALFVSLILLFVYKDLITLWIGADKYAGNNIIYLLLIYSFIGQVAYFMGNVGYALGDIKRNSAFNIIRNIVFGITMFFSARYYGIPGTLVGAIVLCFGADFFYFAHRVYSLGYLEKAYIKNTVLKWVVILPSSLLFGWFLKMLVEEFIGYKQPVIRMLLLGGTFTGCYVTLLLCIDAELYSVTKLMVRKLAIFSPFRKKLNA